MKKGKISHTDITFFEENFHFENFLRHEDYRSKPWFSDKWRVSVFEWQNLSEESTKFSKLIDAILRFDKEIRITSFPVHLDSDFFAFESLEDFFRHVDNNEDYLLTAYVIYSKESIIIIEPDMELIICAFTSDELLGIAKSKELSIMTFEQYLTHIQELKNLGLI